MPERERRPDLDERFSLNADPEDVLRALLGTEDDAVGEDVDGGPEQREA